MCAAQAPNSASESATSATASHRLTPLSLAARISPSVTYTQTSRLSQR